MRRLKIARRPMAGALVAAIVMLGATACKREAPPAAASEEPIQVPPSEMVSVLAMGDPHADVQLADGFYSVEAKSWRWTKKSFSLQLKTPDGASKSGAELSLKFNLPDAVETPLGPVTLSATVNGVALPAETYSKSGNSVYTKPVAASALSGDVARVVFTLDKALPPSSKDSRELGVIAVSAGLTIP